MCSLDASVIYTKGSLPLYIVSNLIRTTPFFPAMMVPVIPAHLCATRVYSSCSQGGGGGGGRGEGGRRGGGAVRLQEERRRRHQPASTLPVWLPSPQPTGEEITSLHYALSEGGKQLTSFCSSDGRPVAGVSARTGHAEGGGHTPLTGTKVT